MTQRPLELKACSIRQVTYNKVVLYAFAELGDKVVLKVTTINYNRSLFIVGSSVF